MTYRYTTDPENPYYKDERRRTVFMHLDHTLAEARYSVFNISLSQYFISTHREDLRSGNEHALEETLQRPLKGLLLDGASPGGGVEANVVPQPGKDNVHRCFSFLPACILPTVKVQSCSCEGTNFTVSPGKPVILIIINGRYDLHQPLYVCQSCQQQWSPNLKDLLRSGYWPATVNTSTLYSLDLLSSFQELKVISPGFSRQAFAKLLEHRTKCGGRTGHISGDALQRNFLEFTYASFEEDQLCCGEPFTCLACTPEMLAVVADGNRKLYRFRRSGRSDDPGFFEGLFVAKDSAVSEFVDTIRRSVKNTQGRGTCGDSQWTASNWMKRGWKLQCVGMDSF
ncbi:uncharacterized protein LOC131981385 [Centropristis striata]|uniref:uncharacterized protein LOC131981385 n=1 Tax=Centropristis striata TaxID=184440 RepID=UPI0027E1B92A|nr:uncharacterized protein LOC131981385 [Centropristis striata]